MTPTSAGSVMEEKLYDCCGSRWSGSLLTFVASHVWNCKYLHFNAGELGQVRISSPAASMVIVAGVVLRAKYSTNPDSVYRSAMRKLNTSAAVLEVTGASLSGTDLRAYIMSGGGLRFKGLRPRLAGKRCFIILPIRGSERKGLVSLEVKKKKGKYDFKLLAVDVPTARGDQRLFLVGDENEYKVGGGLISELRYPIVTAMAAQKEFEELDMKEEEEEERREAEEDEKKLEAELEKLETDREVAYREMEEYEARLKEEKAGVKEEEKKERVTA